MPSAKASGSDANGAGSARSRDHKQGNQNATWTPEQEAAALRIKKCSASAFYEILAIDKTAKTAQIKKAYYKQSLLSHPDKNKHPDAAEAFKKVAYAFEILNDDNKRSIYDQTGVDPNAKHAPGPAAGSGFGGGRSAGGGGAQYATEISPEELFARFFNGGFGGMGGGSGPQFVFNMGGGGPGIRMHQFGGGVPRRRPRPTADGQSEPPVDGWGLVRQLLPLLLLFVLPLLSSLFSGSSTTAGPTYRFGNPATPHTMGRTTPKLDLRYYVNPVDVEDFSQRKFRQLDQRVELDYVSSLKHDCDREVNARERMIQEAQGWFFPDIEKMKEARAMELTHCRMLDSLRGKY
ncbi:J domain-containing protein [Penicillium sp. IBT 18751x]|nr:J domain-containing protein [Penicillium sp. IBT 18751x]